MVTVGLAAAFTVCLALLFAVELNGQSRTYELVAIAVLAMLKLFQVAQWLWRFRRVKLNADCN